MTALLHLVITAILTMGTLPLLAEDSRELPERDNVEIGTALTIDGMEWFRETKTELERLAELTIDSSSGQFGLHCWEDEVVILVVSHPYNPTSELVGEFGCVPADNLPVNGYRP